MRLGVWGGENPTSSGRSGKEGLQGKLGCCHPKQGRYAGEEKPDRCALRKGTCTARGRTGYGRPGNQQSQH